MGKDVHRYNTTIIKANLYLTRTDGTQHCIILCLVYTNLILYFYKLQNILHTIILTQAIYIHPLHNSSW